jgi:DNA-binding NtrC family response regulator
MNENTVLLIDDEEEFLSVLAERLGTRGLIVHTAASGQEALEKAETTAFDAILLDMAMPGLNGLDTLRRLLDVNANFQVILLTGRATLREGVDAMKLGALDLIEKPADITILVAKLQEAAQRKWALDDQEIQKRITDITREKGW